MGGLTQSGPRGAGPGPAAQGTALQQPASVAGQRAAPPTAPPAAQPQQTAPAAPAARPTPATTARRADSQWYDPIAAKLPETVQAVAAVIAIVFTWRTVVGANRAHAEQRELAELARRERYFRQYVVDPSVAEITTFRETAVTLLQTTLTAEQAQLTAAGLGASTVARVAEQFSVHLFALRERLSFADAALGRTPLWEDVDQTLRALEDAVAEGLNDVAAGRGAAVDFPGLVRQHCADVLYAIYRYDLTAHTRAPAIGRLARMTSSVRTWWGHRPAKATARERLAVPVVAGAEQELLTSESVPGDTDVARTAPAPATPRPASRSLASPTPSSLLEGAGQSSDAGAPPRTESPDGGLGAPGADEGGAEPITRVGPLVSPGVDRSKPAEPAEP